MASHNSRASVVVIGVEDRAEPAAGVLWRLPFCHGARVYTEVQAGLRPLAAALNKRLGVEVDVPRTVELSSEPPPAGFAFSEAAYWHDLGPGKKVSQRARFEVAKVAIIGGDTLEVALEFVFPKSSRIEGTFEDLRRCAAAMATAIDRTLKDNVEKAFIKANNAKRLSQGPALKNVQELHRRSAEVFEKLLKKERPTSPGRKRRGFHDRTTEKVIGPPRPDSTEAKADRAARARHGTKTSRETCKRDVAKDGTGRRRPPDRTR
jgi:hypothetical protein